MCVFRRSHCIFYSDDGGFAATDEDNSPKNYIYYLGIIDILTPYNFVKKIEHAWKSLSYDKVYIYLYLFPFPFFLCLYWHWVSNCRMVYQQWNHTNMARDSWISSNLCCIRRIVILYLHNHSELSLINFINKQTNK